MSRTKTRAATRSTKARQNNNGAPSSGEVMTLAEAAAYLRVAPEEVVGKIATERLPARQFGAEWRFFKTALQAWLSAPPPEPPKKGFFDTHFGALKDDPYLEEMLEEIYRQRGRPMTEQG